MPKDNRSNSVESYSIEKNHEYGEQLLQDSRYDLLKIVMIRLGKEPTKDKNFFGALSAIFSDTMELEDKVNACEDNGYPIVENNLRERIGSMSDLGKSIEFQTAKKIALNMLKNGSSVEKTAEMTELSVAEVKEILASIKK